MPMTRKEDRAKSPVVRLTGELLRQHAQANDLSIEITFERNNFLFRFSVHDCPITDVSITVDDSARNGSLKAVDAVLFYRDFTRGSYHGTVERLFTLLKKSQRFGKLGDT